MNTALFSSKIGDRETPHIKYLHENEAEEKNTVRTRRISSHHDAAQDRFQDPLWEKR